jgi:hypothetical protein
VQNEGLKMLKKMISPNEFERYECTSPNLARVRKKNSTKLLLRETPSRQSVRDCIFKEVLGKHRLASKGRISKKALSQYFAAKPEILIAMGINQRTEVIENMINRF